MRPVSGEETIALTLPRPKIDTTAATKIVEPIMEDVRNLGAPALYDLGEKFDGVRPTSLLVPKEAFADALKHLDPKVRSALEVAIRNARLAHSAQMPSEQVTEVIPGGTVIQRWVPLSRVGLYVPGGLAVYPSSVVMNVVTAQVAGVKSMVVASPPQKAFGGLPHPTILAACALLGVDEVIAVGGAQAVAAMVFGFTDDDADGGAPAGANGGAPAGLDAPYTCKPVDLVTGPGNIYVAAAKRVASQYCAIDSEAGTTEIAILADETANARYVAADLISQAEHDPAAASVLVTDSEALALAVQEVLPALVAETEHKDRIIQALNGQQSAIVLTADLERGIEVIEQYAPEHLEVMTKDALDVSLRIRSAGAIFVGDYAPVPLGDYVAGSNHVLPTGGTARYASGLNVTQFLRSVQVIDYSKDALKQMTPPLVDLATAEGLPAHAQAAQRRFSEDEGVPGGLDLDEGVPGDSERADNQAARSGDAYRNESGGTEANHAEPVDFTRLPLRDELEAVKAYGAPVLDVPVRLNVNENPFAPNEAVIDSITAAVRDAAGGLNRYADRDALALREELATYVSAESSVPVTAGQIWAANGSNEVMLQLLQAFGGPGRIALAQWPTYSMYGEYARDTNTEFRLLGAKKADKKHKKPPKFNALRFIRAMSKYQPAVIFIPNPNNPTGSPVKISDLKAILRAARHTGPPAKDAPGGTRATLVIVDEAYAEFREPGTESAIMLLADNPHLVVTRTMSKAFAAAGLRLGYMITSPRIVAEVQKVRLPYHLSLLTQAAAVATLKHADAQLAQVSYLRDQRNALAKWLSEEGLQVAPSASNFLLFGPLEDASETWRQLVTRGVLIREVGPSGYLRVTVGTAEENEAFKQALREIL